MTEQPVVTIVAPARTANARAWAYLYFMTFSLQLIRCFRCRSFQKLAGQPHPAVRLALILKVRGPSGNRLGTGPTAAPWTVARISRRPPAARRPRSAAMGA